MVLEKLVVGVCSAAVLLVKKARSGHPQHTSLAMLLNLPAYDPPRSRYAARDDSRPVPSVLLDYLELVFVFFFVNGRRSVCEPTELAGLKHSVRVDPSMILVKESRAISPCSARKEDVDAARVIVQVRR